MLARVGNNFGKVAEKCAILLLTDVSRNIVAVSRAASSISPRRLHVFRLPKWDITVVNGLVPLLHFLLAQTARLGDIFLILGTKVELKFRERISCLEKLSSDYFGLLGRARSDPALEGTGL
jgi:hypothetical protein